MVTHESLVILSIHTCTGKVTINFEKLPECQEYDSWHQLIPVTGKATTSKGTLRLIAIFNVSKIPMLEWDQ